ncbi:uncharacterized protein I206_102536 [Kwoniella pini CBS 10737]|uniref:Methyltransferase small domain-containing protein n=1 Tax=Kwoniella pini CBS 10737 TaxID=1296096 RepID=A0A1B9I5N1_9TREE|nr:uncharacterized protein I206_02887 [Kwoniella pini CBS 10737]OCF50830.1 hypothetical protein I206_02887 [Kwoniella pini CBS 10737]
MASIKSITHNIAQKKTIPSVQHLISLPNIATTSRKLYSTTSTSEHITKLLENKELTKEDATNELRWIIQGVRERAQNQMAKGKMPEIEEDSISNMVERRSKGEPLQYILGTTDFGPITIQCRKPILIPRQETSFLTLKLSSYILNLIPSLTSKDRPNKSLEILDLCSGTGCIGLLLSKLNPLINIIGIDNSPKAIQLSMINSRDLNLNERVKFKYGNLFNSNINSLLSFTNSSLIPSSSLTTKTNLKGDGKYGMIISNPPYIPFNEYKNLPKSVKNFESPFALLGDNNLNQNFGKGLKYYERINEILPNLLIEQENLEKNGWKGLPRLVLEIGKGQSNDVIDILRNGGLIKKTEIWKDQFGVERFILAWTKK